MLKVSTLSFGHLRNAEHVSFMTNVLVTIEKVGAESLGLTAQQVSTFSDAINQEQDIVNRSQASVYTKEMQAIDLERDRVFRLIRYRLESCVLVGDDHELAEHRSSILTNILAKYGIDVSSKPYQDETALLRGFILDLKTLFQPAVLTKMNISAEIEELEMYNEQFTRQYNERATERSGTETAFSLKLRGETEELYRHLILHFEFKANNEPDSDMGRACAATAAIVEEIIKDARRALNIRLGKGGGVVEEETLQTETLQTETLQTSL